MLGGLTPRLLSKLDANLQEKLAEPLSPPEVGSVLFARQELAKQQGLNVSKSA